MSIEAIPTNTQVMGSRKPFIALLQPQGSLLCWQRVSNMKLFKGAKSRRSSPPQMNLLIVG
jgi:hypothetical protein